MKAIIFERTGPPEVMQYVDVDMPKPAPEQVLVRAHSIGVGLPEVLVRSGQYAWMPPLPMIPGIEMSGTIDQIGKDVTQLKIGQAVFVSAREFSARGGCYAEYIAVDADAIYPLPEGIDLEEAAALSNFQVAWHLLHSALCGINFQSFLATASSGGVGTALVQLGKASDKQVFGIVRSKEQADFVLGLGADSVIDEKAENITERIRTLTSDRGVDVIFDSIGGPGFTKQFERLAPFGILVSYGQIVGYPTGDALGEMQRLMGACPGLRFFSMHALDQDRPKRRQATEEIIGFLARGQIKPPIWKRLALAEASKAHTLISSGKVLGKIILKPRA